jgi:predicted  nucleic acid-binding Zn-ribbon protein
MSNDELTDEERLIINEDKQAISDTPMTLDKFDKEVLARAEFYMNLAKKLTTQDSQFIATESAEFFGSLYQRMTILTRQISDLGDKLDTISKAIQAIPGVKQ